MNAGPYSFKYDGGTGVGTLDIASYLTSQEAGSALGASVVIEREPVVWNLPIDHWSPSSFSMLQRCPRQWQERYIHGRKERPAEAPVIGSAVHKAVEMNFRQKIESFQDIPLPELLDYFVDLFPVMVRDEEERAGDELRWDTSLDKARDRGRAMLGGYQNKVSPRMQPLAVETAISVDLGLHVPVEGRFDFERDESVVDLKSGKQANRKPKESWRVQAAIYGTARDKAVEFHSVSASPKTNAVSVVTPLESEDLLVRPNLREREEMSRTLRALSDLACFYMGLYGPDDPWPTLGRFHTWACGFCGFRGDCPAWQGVES